MAELEKPASISPQKPVIGDRSGDQVGEKEPAVKTKVKKGLNWKIFLFGGAGIFVVFTLILTTLVGRGGGIRFGGGRPEPLVPTPTTVPTPVVPDFDLGDPTVYSNDPQILQLEGALKNFERQLEEVDFREQDLDPPTLLMEVDFTLPRN